MRRVLRKETSLISYKKPTSLYLSLIQKQLSKIFVLHVSVCYSTHINILNI